MAAITHQYANALWGSAQTFSPKVSVPLPIGRMHGQAALLQGAGTLSLRRATGQASTRKASGVLNND